MENENHEMIILEDLGQFGGFHRIPEVKTCLCTKFQVNRREANKIQTFQNLDFNV